MLRKFVAYYKRKHTNVQNELLVDLKLLSFLLKKHWIYKELGQFQKFIFIQNDKQKNTSCTRTI